MHEVIAHYQDVRQRLRRPPNAVPDRPIDLRHGRAFGVKGDVPSFVLLPTPVPVPEMPARSEVTKINFVPKRPRPSEPREPTLQDILDAVCVVAEMRPIDIKAARRTADVVVPRHIVMLLAKMLTRSSLPAIGRFLGGKDHTTVLYALRKLKPLENAVRLLVSENAPLLMYALAALNLHDQMKDDLDRRGRYLRTAKAA